MRILVVGEKFIDKYHLGTTTRVSPEAPVPVVLVKEVIQLSGGAGNVAENLRALGAQVDCVFQPSPYPTKNRLMVGDTQVARWDEHDTASPITQLPLSWLYDGVVISDYAKGALTPALVTTLRKVIPPETPVFIDTKKDPALYRPFMGQAFFFPNLHEHETHYRSYLDCVHVVLTKGARGMEYRYQNETLHTETAKAENVRSVNGAGDTVVAAFALNYISTQNIPNSLSFASACAADVVSRPYTSTPNITHDATLPVRPHYTQAVGA